MKLEVFLETYNKFLSAVFNKDFINEAAERSRTFAVDEDQLSEEVAICPATFNYIATLHGKAQKERNKAKLEVKTVEAMVKRELSNATDNQGKKLTVDAIGARAMTDPRVLQAQADYISSEELVDQLAADEEAARLKGQMLYLLAASIKREQTLKGAI